MSIRRATIGQMKMNVSCFSKSRLIRNLSAPNAAIPPNPSSTMKGRSSGGVGGGGGARGGARGDGSGGGSSKGAGSGLRRPQAKRQQRSSSRPKTIIGKDVKDGLLSFKGADLTARVHNDVTFDALRKYITDSGVTVVELEALATKHQRFQSFRLRVKRSDLKQIEQAEFWPEGVVLSPFFRPKGKEDQMNADSNSAADRLVSNG